MYWKVARGLMFARLRCFDDAERCLHAAHVHLPEDPWHRFAAAELAWMQDDWQQAATLCSETHEKAPMMYANHHLMGRLAVKQDWLPQFLDTMRAVVLSTQNLDSLALHVHYLLSQSERVPEPTKRRLYEEATEVAQGFERVSPLADKRCRDRISGIRLTIATAARDPDAMAEYAQSLRSPYHRKLAEAMTRNRGKSVVWVPHEPVWQAHNTCLPCSIRTLLPDVDTDRMIQELTWGGTNLRASIDWLEAQTNFTGVPFVGSEETLRTLAREGIGCVYLIGGENWSHAIATVGVDELTEELILHDPSGSRPMRVPLDQLNEREGCLGPQCVALVPKPRRDEVERWIPLAQRLPHSAYLEFYHRLRLDGIEATVPCIEDLERALPDHTMSKRLRALYNSRTGRVGAAIDALETLLTKEPDNMHLRMDLIDSLYRCHNTRRMTDVYRELYSQGNLHGVRGVANTRTPALTARYADYLRATRDGSRKAETLLKVALRNHSHEGEIWHILADLFWVQGRMEEAVLPMRVAAHQYGENEHYARSVFDVLDRLNRPDEGLAFLEKRAESAGTAHGASAAWRTWVDALEDTGRPDRASSVLKRALTLMPEDADLLSFAASYWAHNGEPARAEALLPELDALQETYLARWTRMDVYQRIGRWEEALELAELFLSQSPSDAGMARRVLDLRQAAEGGSVAIPLAREWVEQHPGNESFEEILYDQYQDQFFHKQCETLLRRRLDDNPHDTWAWIELGHVLLRHVELTSGDERQALMPEVQRVWGKVEALCLPGVRTLLLKGRIAAAEGHVEAAREIYAEAIDTDCNQSAPIDRWLTTLDPLPVEQRKDLLEHMLAKLKERGCTSSSLVDFFEKWSVASGLRSALRQVNVWLEQAPSRELARAEIRLLLDSGRSRKDAERALALLEERVKQFPADTAFLFARAEAHGALQDTEAMKEGFDELVSRYPLHAASRQNLAVSLMRDGEMDAAVDLLREGIARQPQDREMWRVLANFLQDRQDWEGCISTLQEAVKRMPRDIGLGEYLIDMCIRLGDEDRAMTTAQRLVDAFPDGAYLWYLYGMTLERTQFGQQVAKVEEAYRKALSLNCALYDAMDSLCAFLTQNGRLDDARAVIDDFPNPEREMPHIRGRRIWLQACVDEGGAAAEAMFDLLKEYPAYTWGWARLLEWLEEKGSKEQIAEMLGSVPEVVQHDAKWRLDRLGLFEDKEISCEPSADEQWAELVREFPDVFPVQLRYIDRCFEKEDWVKGKQTLNAFETLTGQTTFTDARVVQWLVKSEGKWDEALERSLAMWGRTGWDSEWADGECFSQLVAVESNRKRLVKAVFQVLSDKRHIRPDIVSRCLDDILKKKAPMWSNVIEAHPGRAHFLAPLLTAYTDHDLDRDAHKLLLRLTPADLEWSPTWRAALRSWNASEAYWKHPEKMDALVDGWQNRPGNEMYAMCNYLLARTKRIGSFLDSPLRGPSSVQREQALEIARLAEEVLSTLRLDDSSHAVAVIMAMAQLCNGDRETFLNWWNLSGSPLKEKKKDDWSNDRLDCAHRQMLSLRTILEASPVKMKDIQSLAKNALEHDDGPMLMFTGLMGALHERQLSDVAPQFFGLFRPLRRKGTYSPLANRLYQCLKLLGEVIVILAAVFALIAIMETSA